MFHQRSNRNANGICQEYHLLPYENIRLYNSITDSLILGHSLENLLSHNLSGEEIIVMNLFTNENIHQLSLKGWQKDAIVKFTKKISDKERPFPCIPATMGYHLNSFYYGFVPNLQTPISSMEFAHLLKEYSSIYKSLGMPIHPSSFFMNHFQI